MTLYEEVGLNHDASAEEVRQAYHYLVKQLHPDAVQDPTLRQISEAQLRRLNGAFEILTDPKRRAAYDASIHPNPGPAALAVVGRESVIPAAGGRMRTDASLWGIGALAIVLVVGFGTWATPQKSPPVEPADPSQPAPRAQAAVSPPRPVERHSWETRQLAAEVRRLRQEMEQARQRRFVEAARATEHKTASDPGMPGAQFDEPALAQPAAPSPVATARAAPAASTPSPPVAHPTHLSLAGTWLYAQRPGEAPRKDWYPPDFIELKIQASPSGIAGRYQARYRVGDRPISPEVRFRFEGSGEILHWASADGARGDVRLRQTSPMTLQVEWNTTHAGNTPALSAGSSVLVKSQE